MREIATDDELARNFVPLLSAMWVPITSKYTRIACGPGVTLLHKLLDLGSIACNQIVRDDELGKSRSADELTSAGICPLNHPGRFGSADRSAGNSALCLQLWVRTRNQSVSEYRSTAHDEAQLVPARSR
jgi:hypothetical protein